MESPDERRVPLAMLTLLGKPPIPQQEDNFLKRGVLRQCMDVEPVVAEDPGFAVDVTNLRFSGNDAFESCACTSHACPYCFPFVRAIRAKLLDENERRERLIIEHGLLENAEFLSLPPRRQAAREASICQQDHRSRLVAATRDPRYTVRAVTRSRNGCVGCSAR
jgi:hypothetical protein